MSTIYQKIPFFLELFFNGIFILLYSLQKSEANILKFVPSGIFNSVIQFAAYCVPIVIFTTMVLNYLNIKNIDEFIRKYVFSFIVFVPLLITYGDLEFSFWLAAVHLFSSILSLYDVKSLKEFDEDKTDLISIGIVEKLKLKPAQIVILTFFGIIFLGSLLLLLPISSVEGKDISAIDALFMATSATCVTGLSTISLVDNFSTVGQIIMLILIQIGGLGIMTLSSAMTILLGKSLAMKNQVVMQGLLDISSLEDLISMIVDIVKYTIVIELWGGIILSFAFSFEGYEIGEAIYFGFYHSVSAFCNAGFALFNNSLVDFTTSPVINGTITVLIVLGGLGFIVLKELKNLIMERNKFINLSLHTKIVLVSNIILIFLGTIYIFFSEFLHGIDSYSLFDKLQISLFQSITTRTAGFNTVPLNNLHTHTLYLMALFMFIGASPGSTGGGIKTTTFAILFQSVKATLKGKERVEFFDRRIPNYIVVRATAIIIISLMIVSFFILLMMRLEPEHSFLAIFFEIVSAFATVGLSLGITPYLTAFGKLGLVLLMFIGRVGPLTLALAIGENTEVSGKLEYPEGRVIIG